MSLELILPEIFKNSKNLESRSPEYFEKSKAEKQNAKAYLEQFGLPTKNHEDWLYTQVQKFMAFRPFEHKTDLVQNVPDLLKVKDADHLVFVNGILNHALTEVTSAIKIEENVIEENETFFDSLHALNTYLALRSYQITLPKKLELTKPIVIVHLFDENALNRIVAPKIKILAEDFTKASFLEIFGTSNRDLYQYTVNADLNLELKNNSHIEYVKVNAGAKKATHIAHTKNTIGRDSLLNLFTFDLGVLMSRENIESHLMDNNATSNHFGAILLKKEEHGDVFTKVTHHKAHTYSEQVVKTVLAENAHGVFTGKLAVIKDAQQINASQLNNNLLLSKKAHIDTRPQLEVNADDVKCAHGATIGQLSKDEEFYLESRGLSKAKAKTMLCHGFLFEIVYKIENSLIKEKLNQLIELELKNVDFASAIEGN
ncbi:MAG: Fe-S cluster assembly protein SufD [Bacteriovoracaceae bacterium]|nr:Fe-S cluster assembly protein SufD [Bacteriovoracaceae bacterium]